MEEQKLAKHIRKMHQGDPYISNENINTNWKSLQNKQIIQEVQCFRSPLMKTWLTLAHY